LPVGPDDHGYTPFAVVGPSVRQRQCRDA
jgi:hypothetical protein